MLRGSAPTCCASTPRRAPNERKETSFEIVEKLTEMGVSATDVKKLKEAGFYTVQSLFMRPRKVRTARPVVRGRRTDDQRRYSPLQRPRLAGPLRKRTHVARACAHASWLCERALQSAGAPAVDKPRGVRV